VNTNIDEDFTSGEVILLNPEYPLLPTPNYIGAYLILHHKTNMLYVGSTDGLYGRRHEHLTRLKTNTHSNGNLQKAYDDDKEISFYVIQFTDSEEDALDIEQSFLDSYFTTGILFNINPNARSSAGVKRTEEQKLVISKTVTEVWKDPEHRKLKSNLMVKYYSNPENLAKHIERAKVFGSDPDFIAKQKANADLQWSDQNVRDKKAEEVSAIWSNPERNVNLLAAHKARRKQVSVDGVIYASHEDVAKVYNISIAAVTGRIISDKRPTWFYIEKDFNNE